MRCVPWSDIILNGHPNQININVYKIRAVTLAVFRNLMNLNKKF